MATGQRAHDPRSHELGQQPGQVGEGDLHLLRDVGGLPPSVAMVAREVEHRPHRVVRPLAERQVHVAPLPWCPRYRPSGHAAASAILWTCSCSVPTRRGRAPRTRPGTSAGTVHRPRTMDRRVSVFMDPQPGPSVTPWTADRRPTDDSIQLRYGTP
ncbi:MAG: DUF3678 domain-containing protein [Nitriliruptor sp.]|nr:MAG: DUF3678 domain-containing protein [Nitriliruptor sp.]